MDEVLVGAAGPVPNGDPDEPRRRVEIKLGVPLIPTLNQPLFLQTFPETVEKRSLTEE